jgi:hypothetical protein
MKHARLPESPREVLREGYKDCACEVLDLWTKFNIDSFPSSIVRTVRPRINL